MTLSEAVKILSSAGVENPLYDARQIFSMLGGIPMSELVLGGEVADGSRAAYAVEQRSKRIPLEYIMGSVDFYRERYIVREGCLIPRDDTEILVDYAVNNLPRGAFFVDLCTGSGCIALSVLNNTERTTALAVDISDTAIEIARENASRLGLSDRISLSRSNVMADPVVSACYAVLSNPPYVAECDYMALSDEIKCEPRIAFVGGDDGLDFYRAITEKYRNVIDDSGFIAFEIGYNQAVEIADIASKNRMSCEILRDLSGNFRVAVLRKII